MTDPVEDYISFEKRGALAVVTLNYPEKLNVVTIPRARVLNQAIREFNKDPDLRVCLLNAKGKSFCAGRDISVQAETGESPTKGVDQDIWWYGLPPTDKFLVTSGRGYAVGVGGYYLLAGDVAIASETLKLGLREVPTAVLGPYFLQQAENLPWKVAFRMAVVGDDFAPDELARFGLVTKVVPDDDLEDVTQDWIDRLLSLPPRHAMEVKRLMRKFDFQYTPEILKEEYEIRAELDALDDTREAAQAFVERRTPRFTGR